MSMNDRKSVAGERAHEGFRGFLRRLEEAGELQRISEPLSLRYAAKVIEASDQAVMIEHPIGSDLPIVANIMATHRRWALAFDVPADQVMHELRRRSANPIPAVTVESGPVHEVVELGDEADLGSLPVYLQHELDGGPYISAALDVSRHPETRRNNIGVRRLMLRGPRETGVDVVAPSDLRAYYRRAREQGTRFEIAFCIGLHPLDYMATQAKEAVDDEFATMGGFRLSPVELVRCKTVDLEVPADAEIVVEGFLEGDWTETEGPFGEYHGCYGSSHLNPVFKVTAITRRSDAMFQSATIGGRALQHTDTAAITALRTELIVWEAVSRAVAGDVRVYCPTAATGLHHARVAIEARDPGDGKNAALAALASYGEIKMAIVVDDDIDIHDDSDVEWALSTRVQADRDCVTVSGLRTFPLDPSLPPHEGSAVTASKLGIDATRRYDRPARIFDRPESPYWESGGPDGLDDSPSGRDPDEVARVLEETLDDGPRFVDWLERFPEMHQSEIVSGLGILRRGARLVMDRDGRFWKRT